MNQIKMNILPLTNLSLADGNLHVLLKMDNIKIYMLHILYI